MALRGRKKWCSSGVYRAWGIRRFEQSSRDPWNPIPKRIVQSKSNTLVKWTSTLFWSRTADPWQRFIRITLSQLAPMHCGCLVRHLTNSTTRNLKYCFILLPKVPKMRAVRETPLPLTVSHLVGAQNAWARLSKIKMLSRAPCWRNCIHYDN